MRKLDLIGMIFTIIGINIIIINGLIFLYTPEIFIYLYPFYLKLCFAILITGVSTVVAGIILRIINGVTKDKTNERDLEIIKRIMDYLNDNKGKAFSANSLLKRIHWGSTYGLSERSIKRLLHDLIINDLIESYMKDGQKFYSTIEK